MFNDDGLQSAGGWAAQIPEVNNTNKIAIFFINFLFSLCDFLPAIDSAENDLAGFAFRVILHTAFVVPDHRFIGSGVSWCPC